MEESNILEASRSDLDGILVASPPEAAELVQAYDDCKICRDKALDVAERLRGWWGVRQHLTKQAMISSILDCVICMHTTENMG